MVASDHQIPSLQRFRPSQTTHLNIFEEAAMQAFLTCLHFLYAKVFRKGMDYHW